MKYELIVQIGVNKNYYTVESYIDDDGELHRTISQNIAKIGKVKVVEGLTEIIKLNAILKGFGSNKLTAKKVYETQYFTARTVAKNGVVNLHINFLSEHSKDEYFDKLEASMLSEQLSKIISQLKF